MHGNRLTPSQEVAEALGWYQVDGEFELRLEMIAEVKPSPAPMSQRLDGRPKYDCRTVILSDIHLGTTGSKADDVVDSLKHIRCKNSRDWV